MNDKPSPPWFGALILGCLVLATAWILTYTLAPLPGQGTLGGWNYVIVGVLLNLFVGLSMAWHGDPRETSSSKASSEAKAAQGVGADSSAQGGVS